MTKRGFDLLLALLGLTLLAPVFLIVWALIKLDDGGPGFFSQIRVGRQGRLFRIVKFRTMYVGADKEGLSITVTGDRRITRIGHFLRNSKIDELPQLWNVLRGEMSFVGPRPEVPQYVARYTSIQREVLTLKPGITDEASIRYRNEEMQLAVGVDPEQFYIEHCIPRKIQLNLAYSRHANTFRDLGVIVRTIGLVWLRR